jgi:hypothetical protein
VKSGRLVGWLDAAQLEQWPSFFPGDYFQIQIQVLIFQKLFEIQMISEFDQTSSFS